MRFSLVIAVAPYRNAEILGSIKEMNFPKKNYEIIIEKGTNASDNRNRGVKKSKGELIAFLDDDAVADKELLKNADNFFKKHPEIDIVGGPQLTPLDEKGFAKISGYVLSSKFGGWSASNRYGKKKLNLNADDTYLTSAIMFCRKEVMKKIKFDPNLWPGEDSKFVTDAKKEGFKVAYNPELIIYHRRRPTLKGLIKQIFNYGRVGPLREKFSETIKRPFFLIPSLFLIYLVFLGGLFFVINPILKFIFLFPLFLYLSLDLLFSAYESIKNKDLRGILFLPFIFPIIHLSYGAGWIYSYLKKILKRKN
ncbi:Dolichyl N-acetyl-alpha-D-glucosaminyl phosphate 3-beta-D-2,3-diacetamido-2,3-dideoxy-beta-D-glucuronosyltransferase [uncultured archaeon]|nr:Dolichyl N-acetyl-alpha-D-glucosaminyl phosphate 3-beta-D-2,3-diacetamido-2,3-dideoxy-beta-D-glucuronosyltransferase [uncultured archaeon]